MVKALNAALENWILSLPLPQSSCVLLGKSLKPGCLQVGANCVCLIFWVPDLRPWGLVCRSTEQSTGAVL